MDTIDETILTAATEESEPSRNQFVKNRGRTPSPPLKNRVIVYDCNQRTVEVQNKEDVAHHPDYKKIHLPPRKNEVTIYVDPKTLSEPTTENTAPDGHSNVMLAKIYLDRLGPVNQVLRFLGQLSTLYVRIVTPWSDTSSLVSGPHSVHGVA
ncbi:hypothetical protein MMC24_001435 [Lignoscripta atroalba]|nr:hypothetical protein [Lignoscripta atroalba]